MKHRIKRCQTGFTLTEIAIVLAIVGIILGTIWAATAMVYENNRSQRAVDGVLTIVSNWRTLLANQPMDYADSTNLNQFSINNNLVPAEMITTSGGWCHVGGADPVCFLPGPWGNQVTIVAYRSYNAIAVQHSGLTQSACNRLANALASSAGVMEMIISGTTTLLAPFTATTTLTTSQISTQCNKSDNTNGVFAMYPMN